MEEGKRIYGIAECTNIFIHISANMKKRKEKRRREEKPFILSEIHCILKRIHYFNPFYDSDNEIKSYVVKWKVQ